MRLSILAGGFFCGVEDVNLLILVLVFAFFYFLFWKET
jgi:hypothetical protein